MTSALSTARNHAGTIQTLLRYSLAAMLLAFSTGTLAQVGDGISYFLWNARYAELERAADAENAKQAMSEPWPLALLCYAHWKVKRYAKLFECANQLETLVKAGHRTMEHKDAPLIASDISALPQMLRANAWLELGANRRALEAAKEALAAIPDASAFSYFSFARYNIETLPVAAIAAYLLGDQPASDQYLAQLQKLRIGWPNSDTLPNLREYQVARIYMIRGDYAKALQHAGAKTQGSGTLALQNLFTSRESDDDLSNTFEIGKQFMVAKSLLETGQRAGAKKVFDQLLAKRRLADQGDIHWPVLYERGRIAEMEGDTREAIEYYKRAIEVIELQRASINTEASKIGFVGDKQAVYLRLVAALVGENRTTDAFAYVERSKARALVDMLAAKEDLAASAPDPARAKHIFDQLNAADAAARIPAPTSAESAARMRALQAAKLTIEQIAPELASLVTVTAVSAEELKKLIGDGEALVEYYYEAGDLYAFVLTHLKLSAFKLSADRLAEDIHDLRLALQDPGSATWHDKAEALQRRLWQPIEGALGVSNVLVVPHGALHYLPFAALRRADGSLLIDHYSFRFLPSASVLKFLKPSTEWGKGSLLVLGNPDLGDPKMDLKFAEDEARAVAKRFPQARLLVRRDASESSFKGASDVFAVIHFATHGKFQSDDPLSSGLYLTKDADNDGLLTVGELYSMKLNADLVTLSACETGLGKIANGDDVVGLARGFLYAGSRSIVASLWSVDDNATAELMGNFYENLMRLPKQKALREAQLKTRQNFPHPFYWAAFQLTGRAD